MLYYPLIKYLSICNHFLMLKISLNYRFRHSQESPLQLQNPLFILLDAIRHSGSISKAATNLGFSYRHVWGALKKWELLLGAELVIWEKGKRAQLSTFGEKLLFAEQRAKARVLPQLDTLINEMEREFAFAFDERIHILSLCASHDLALGRLRDFLAKAAQIHLNLQFKGSMTSLGALSRNECILAGFHICESTIDSATQKSLRKLLKPAQHRLIGFLQRQQGLMVQASNPKKIQGISDLKRGDVRFINREPGSGTRIETEALLKQNSIPFSVVNGFDRIETTHLAVAAAVAYNQADVGFGIKAAAAQFKLDFIPLLKEQYYFACTKQALQTLAIQEFIVQLKSKAWHTFIHDLPGYDTSITGEILLLTSLSPWNDKK